MLGSIKCTFERCWIWLPHYKNTPFFTTVACATPEFESNNIRLKILSACGGQTPFIHATCKALVLSFPVCVTQIWLPAGFLLFLLFSRSFTFHCNTSSRTGYVPSGKGCTSDTTCTCMSVVILGNQKQKFTDAEFIRNLPPTATYRCRVVWPFSSYVPPA